MLNSTVIRITWMLTFTVTWRNELSHWIVFKAVSTELLFTSFCHLEEMRHNWLTLLQIGDIAGDASNVTLSQSDNIFRENWRGQLCSVFSNEIFSLPGHSLSLIAITERWLFDDRRSFEDLCLSIHGKEMNLESRLISVRFIFRDRIGRVQEP